MQQRPDYNQYVQSHLGLWQQAGFKQLPPGPNGEIFLRRRRFEVTKFALVDTFIVATYVPGQIQPHHVENFSKLAYDIGTRNKHALPNGLFGAMVVFPLMVLDSVTPDLFNFVAQTYAPKHWSSFEFPVLFDLSNGYVSCLQRTPTFGAAYFRGFRDEAQRLFTYYG